MSLAWVSVGALVLAVTLSCTTTINVGILSLALALIVGVFLGGMTPAAVLDGFPTELLVTLVGVTLLFAILALVATVAGLGMNVGMMALIIATVLVLARTVDEGKAIQRMPWGVILMVTGVTVLVTMMQQTDGMALITSGIAGVSTPRTIAPVVAFGAGVVSVYSSTSGVVLPAFLPMVPQLSERLGGASPLEIAWSMNVGASLVDLSSLSTVGALYIAGAVPGSDVRRLFNGLLAWGLSMAAVGAALCWALFG